MPDQCHARRFADGQFRCQQCGTVFDADDTPPCEVELMAETSIPVSAGLKARFDTYDRLAANVGLPPLTPMQKARVAAMPDPVDNRRANSGGTKGPGTRRRRR